MRHILKNVPLAAEEKTCTDTLLLEMLLSAMSIFGVLYYDFINLVNLVNLELTLFITFPAISCEGKISNGR